MREDFPDPLAQVERFERARKRLYVLAGLGVGAVLVGMLFALAVS